MWIQWLKKHVPVKSKFVSNHSIFFLSSFLQHPTRCEVLALRMCFYGSETWWWSGKATWLVWWWAGTLNCEPHQSGSTGCLPVLRLAASTTWIPSSPMCCFTNSSVLSVGTLKLSQFCDCVCACRASKQRRRLITRYCSAGLDPHLCWWHTCLKHNCSASLGWG